MDLQKETKIFITIFLVFLTLVSFFIIKSFIIPIVFTFILVYILNPFYQKLLKISNNHFLSSMLIIVIFLTLILTPISYMLFHISNDLVYLKSLEESKLVEIENNINQMFEVNFEIFSSYQIILSSLEQYISNIFLKFPEFLFNLFIIVFFYYYFSKEYNTEIRFFRLFINKPMYKILKDKIEKLIDGVIYGQILIRLVQAGIGLVGFLMLQVNAAIFWGIMLFFVSFLPVLGTAIIWIPIAISFLLNSQITQFILTIILGIFISIIDNLLIDKFISSKTNINPVFILIGIIGGIQIFGFYGLILGPFFLGLLLIFIEELLVHFQKLNSGFRKVIWTKTEREKFRSLKTENEKEEFIRMLNLKYKKSKE